MKILKKIFLFIVGFIALALIAAIFIDGNISYEKSININAPVDSVWKNINSLAAMDKWSPWVDKDPAMKRTNSGTDGTVGAKFCWVSDKKDVGKGCQTIAKLTPNTRIDTDLEFDNGYKSEAKAYVQLTPNGTGTKATWGFTSEMPYPWRIMKLFMNMDKMLDPDYTLGLNRLKKLSEQP